MADTEPRSLSIKKFPRADAIRQMRERGHIKIGQKGEMVTSRNNKTFQPPQKLDHFIITTMERGPDGNFLRDLELEEQIKQRTGQEKLTKIPVFLLNNERDLNFQTRLAAYAGKRLWCKGDGVQAERLAQTGTDKDGMALYDYRPIACPCPNIDPAYVGDKPCKFNGSLSVVITDADSIGGIWKFRTTSYNSVVAITESLNFIMAGTDGVLRGIPLQLTVGPKSVTNPKDQKPLTVYTVGLEFRGSIEELAQIGYEKRAAALANQKRNRQLDIEMRRFLAAPAADAVFVGETPTEVVEEFYPEQAAQGTDANAKGNGTVDSDGVVSTPSKLDTLPTLSKAEPPLDGIEELTGRRTDPKIGLQSTGDTGTVETGQQQEPERAKPASAPSETLADGRPEAVYRSLIEQIDRCRTDEDRQRLWALDARVKQLRENPAASELYDMAYDHYWRRMETKRPDARHG